MVSMCISARLNGAPAGAGSHNPGWVSTKLMTVLSYGAGIKYILYSHTIHPAQCTMVGVGSHDSCMINTSVV